MERPSIYDIGNVALLGIYGVIGIAILLLSFAVVGLAVEQGTKTTKTWAIVSAFGVLVALGFAFVETGGQSGYSFGMALGWALALFANVWLALGRSVPVTGISLGLHGLPADLAASAEEPAVSRGELAPPTVREVL